MSPKKVSYVPVEAWKSCLQQCVLLNTEQRFYIFKAYVLSRPHAGLHFLLALQQHTRAQLAVANCNQQVRNAASRKRNYL